MMKTAERAAQHVLDCLETRPVQLSVPRTIALAVALARVLQVVRAWLTKDQTDYILGNQSRAGVPPVCEFVFLFSVSCTPTEPVWRHAITVAAPLW